LGLTGRTPLIEVLRKPRFSICIETVAVLAYMKFLMVSADSGSLLMVLPPQHDSHPEGEARGTFTDP
jgi:hypothetical protein